MSMKKVEKPSVGNWDTGVNIELQSEVYDTTDSKKKWKSFTSLIMQKL